MPRSAFIPTLLCAFALFSASLAGESAASWSNRAVLTVRRSAVISAEVGYPVTKIHREMGQSFRKGDVLVEFRTVLPEAGVAAARAVLAAAEAGMAAAERMFERNNASLVEVEKARSEFAQAKSRFEAASYELSACVIVAPFDGRVAEVLVNEHELVARGKPIIRIVDDSRLLAKFLLPEDRFGHIGIGDAVGLEIPAVDVRTSGVVSNIAAVMDPASRTFDVWADVDNAAGGLRAGMIAVLADGAGSAR